MGKLEKQASSYEQTPENKKRRKAIPKGDRYKRNTIVTRVKKLKHFVLARNLRLYALVTLIWLSGYLFATKIYVISLLAINVAYMVAKYER